MFDVSPDDISQLNDIDLRELVGRLCEAELERRGLSPVAVTWGGNQTAADGGLDVRVELPQGASIDGFIPRPLSGFQVKKPDMPRSEIIKEMRPKGVIRPVIQELSNEAGAYVMVCSTGSTADTALANRRDALRVALDGVANAEQIHTDFYDRTRLATWVRRHPGLIAWVKEKVGRALVGWRPYGPWSSAADGIDSEYLLDDKFSLHLGNYRDSPPQSVVQGINALRDELIQPGKVVRLVGLSGVGKTRLAQALFDARIGARSLPPSLAVYTNLSDNPDPQPVGLASDLIASHARAILIVDNCPPDLHHRLSDLCSSQSSTVSILTVEYDVRDDHPEGTQVVTLDTSSLELIEKLIQRRYQYLSRVDASTIAEVSGGNARIAIALAETVERSDTIAGLSNENLFQRLFQQRHEVNNALLIAAQACSLVYSFQGEALEGEEAELPCLASLAGQVVTETFRHVGELLRRDLVQQRGGWLAVLPHAIANRLAARALEDIPYDLIDRHLVDGGTKRLSRSFSRRLSFLHDCPRAVVIVEKWLAPNGLLGNVAALNDLGRKMLENVAPVLPEAALAALERAGSCSPDVATTAWQRHQSLLRSLAYDPPLFERSAKLLARVATQCTNKGEAEATSNTFLSLFTIHLSGTHASIDQRLGLIESLLRSPEEKWRPLGLAALDKVLKTRGFSSSYRFEFGARSRDFGYRPRSSADLTRWYGSALALIERLAVSEEGLKPDLHNLLARNFRGLWTIVRAYDELERLSRGFAAESFWLEGWHACRQAMRFDVGRMDPEVAIRLSVLETDLKPANLPERIRAALQGQWPEDLDSEEMNVDCDITSAIQRGDASAFELGAATASDDVVFALVLRDLIRGGKRGYAFGQGLASASPDPLRTWERLVEGLELIATKERSVQVFKGFIAELWENNRNLAQHLLDSILNQQALIEFLVELHLSIDLDDRAIERLKRGLSAGKVPAGRYRNLAFGLRSRLESGVLRDLLVFIADQPDGFEVALEILHMRLFSDASAQRKHEPELLAAGREILQRISFKSKSEHDAYNLAGVVSACLVASDAGTVAADVALRLRQAVATSETYSFNNTDLLTALLEVQPEAVLDALFSGDDEEQKTGIDVFHNLVEQSNPADVISCETLIAWCERDRGRRYTQAAAIITFARRPDENGPQVWSEQAKALLAHAPDTQNLLEVLIERFRPMIWGGSRAALLEANSRLLDSLESLVPSGLMPFVTEARFQLEQEVASDRQWETANDRARDERFE